MSKIYIFSGEEEFLKKEALNKLRASLFVNEDPALNFDVFSLSQTSYKHILETTATAPLLSKKRLVVIKDIEDLKYEDQKQFLKKMAGLPEYTEVVLDMKKSLDRELGDIIAGRSVENRFARPANSAMPRWITEKFEASKKKISPEAAILLKSLRSDSLEALNNEIDKIVTYVENRVQVTKEDIKNIVGGDISESAFALIDAIGQKDLKNALLIGSRLDMSKKSMPELFGLIGSQLRKIHWVKILKRNGLSDQEIKSRLGINDYPYRKLMERINNFNNANIRKAMEILLDIDADLKMGRLNPKEAFQLAMTKIIC